VGNANASLVSRVLTLPDAPVREIDHSDLLRAADVRVAGRPIDPDALGKHGVAGQLELLDGRRRLHAGHRLLLHRGQSVFSRIAAVSKTRCPPIIRFVAAFIQAAREVAARHSD
jgi:hypothetical protein